MLHYEENELDAFLRQDVKRSGSCKTTGTPLDVRAVVTNIAICGESKNRRIIVECQATSPPLRVSTRNSLSHRESPKKYIVKTILGRRITLKSSIGHWYSLQDRFFGRHLTTTRASPFLIRLSSCIFYSKVWM
jgi:hypothetical protein